MAPSGALKEVYYGTEYEMIPSTLPMKLKETFSEAQSGLGGRFLLDVARLNVGLNIVGNDCNAVTAFLELLYCLPVG